jgi:flavin reductase (DIM6/NTAB) family NADH-FMN oxidoreductase RutF
MERKSIPLDQFVARTHYLWDAQWLLLTAGDFSEKQFNTMTVGWGSLGTMWGRPFVQVVVRPTRYTYGFMEGYDTFTLCTFPESYRADVNLLGTKSGRDGDKLAETDLTPIASQQVAAPGFAEAELILECRKIYWDDLEPAHFVDPRIERHYPQKDYHRIYFGEILAAYGTAAYLE